MQDQIDARAAQRQSDGSAGPVHPWYDSPSRRHRAGALTRHSEVDAHPLTTHRIPVTRGVCVLLAEAARRRSTRIGTARTQCVRRYWGQDVRIDRQNALLLGQIV